MIRRIIEIDEDKCNGCALCANACHEEAIIMVDGKARLLRDDYCDGLGDCLPACPVNAISFVHRDTLPYDEEAVMANKKANEEGFNKASSKDKANNNDPNNTYSDYNKKSELKQWPVQIKLAPIQAPYFDNANLLIAADCTAYAYAGFHNEFMKNRVTLIGCPKLDTVDYSEKITEIIRSNNISSVTVVKMEVPCCSGMEVATLKAVEASNKLIPTQVITLSLEGNIIG